MNHHNVAKTLDYFDEGGHLFLVEEFVPGETLEAKLNIFGAIDPHLGCRILLHLSKGIAVSHRVGVIHRDLKPSNVIVQSGVNLHELKITDFGIATLTEEVFAEAAKEGDLTRSTSGTIRGALPFMAPEMMFRSAGEHVGSPADVWSLGAMMFKVLTGNYPFGVYMDAVLAVGNKKKPTWPTFMTSNPQYKPLSEELQAIISSCLEYDSKRRPTADDLVAEVSKLCFINVHRSEGVVTNLIQGGVSGFANGDGETIFFSKESVYGPSSAVELAGRRISYSKFPGLPRHRGHPVVPIK